MVVIISSCFVVQILGRNLPGAFSYSKHTLILSSKAFAKHWNRAEQSLQEWIIFHGLPIWAYTGSMNVKLYPEKLTLRLKAACFWMETQIFHYLRIFFELLTSRRLTRNLPSAVNRHKNTAYGLAWVTSQIDVAFCTQVHQEELGKW